MSKSGRIAEEIHGALPLQEGAGTNALRMLMQRASAEHKERKPHKPGDNKSQVSSPDETKAPRNELT